MLKHIGVFIDFTDLCTTSVTFAKSIAQKSGARISLIHVADKQHNDLQQKFAPYAAELESAGLSVSTVVHVGSFEKIIPEVVAEARVDLVVVGTHGVVGIRQHLFGANILKLTKRLGVNSIVVQEKSAFTRSDIPRILFPVSPQENFPEYVADVISIALILKAEVLIYTVIKSDLGLGAEVEQNRSLAANQLKDSGVEFQMIDEPESVYSFGFGKQIVEFAHTHLVDFISINSKPASELAVNADADKELIIINKYAVPVFCFNK